MYPAACAGHVLGTRDISGLLVTQITRSGGRFGSGVENTDIEQVECPATFAELFGGPDEGCDCDLFPNGKYKFEGADGAGVWIGDSWKTIGPSKVLGEG